MTAGMQITIETTPKGSSNGPEAGKVNEIGSMKADCLFYEHPGYDLCNEWHREPFGFRQNQTAPSEHHVIVYVSSQIMMGVPNG